MDCQAVFFDVGATLLYPCPSVAETFTAVANERGHALTLEDVAPHMAAVDALYERKYKANGDFWCTHDGSINIWLEQYSYLCELTGIADDAESMSHAVRDRFCHADHWGVFDDVVECLGGLKAMGLQLAVISNWDDGLPALLAELGLSRYFDEVLASAAVGLRKPDPAVFEVACERLGVSIERCVHVGDRPDADGGGAAAAGVRPIIIDRGGTLVDCGYERVSALTEIPALVGSLPSWRICKV